MSAADILLRVSGGKGNSPLIVNVIRSATFTATGQPLYGVAGVVFSGFFNGSVGLSSTFARSSSISIGKIRLNALSIDGSNDNAASDLTFLGSARQSWKDGDAVSLSTGVLETAPITVDYPAINSNGHVFLANGAASQRAAHNMTWALVSEPSANSSTYEMDGGPHILGFQCDTWRAAA